MAHVVHRPTPEGRELEKKRAELAPLQTELSQQELDLTTLQAQVHVFETRYFLTVGRLFTELDDLQAQRAEAEARRNPQDSDLHRRASDARGRARESAEAISAAQLQGDAVSEFCPREDLKALYREIAKLVHPDLTTDDRERARRTRLMAEANRAYTAGDEVKLRAILDEWVSSPESVQGEGTGADLVRTIRKIHQVERRLADIQTETSALKASELYTLFQRVAAARAEDRDLLAEMASRLRQQIAAARTALINMSSGEEAV